MKLKPRHKIGHAAGLFAVFAVMLENFLQTAWSTKAEGKGSKHQVDNAENIRGSSLACIRSLLRSSPMFLLRCAFWLSVVYGSMSWGGGALRSHGSFAAATADRSAVAALDTVAQQAVGGVVDLCQGRPAQCAKDAAKLTALVEAAVQKDDLAESIVQDDSYASSGYVPMPTPDPRRHAAGLARTQRP